MTHEDTYYIIGIDGGASKTRGILFTQSGETIATAFEKGSNLAIFGETAANRLQAVINNLCDNANIHLDLVDAIGLGLAGASDKDGRDLVFKMLDGLKLSQRALIANDAEAAYEVNCPGDFGILVTVGTGVICLARNENGETVRTAGKGHEQGDKGSGYWIGKQALLNLSLNETLSRTVITSLTTLMVVVILFILGGKVINLFAFALIVGVFIGTYSSIFVAAPIMLYFERKSKGNPHK